MKVSAGASLAQSVECRTLDRKVAGSNLAKSAVLCVFERYTSSALLRIGSTPETVPTLLEKCGLGRGFSPNKQSIRYDMECIEEPLNPIQQQQYLVIVHIASAPPSSKCIHEISRVMGKPVLGVSEQV